MSPSSSSCEPNLSEWQWKMTSAGKSGLMEEVTDPTSGSRWGQINWKGRRFAMDSFFHLFWLTSVENKKAIQVLGRVKKELTASFGRRIQTPRECNLMSLWNNPTRTRKGRQTQVKRKCYVITSTFHVSRISCIASDRCLAHSHWVSD